MASLHGIKVDCTNDGLTKCIFERYIAQTCLIAALNGRTFEE